MDAVEDIKSRLSIEDVVSEYVQLKRSGRNFKGLSPWTNEKTPSLMVSPEKQIWHDFSSGRGGNMFSFIMEMEGLDFKGALEYLARKAGVDLDQYRTKPNNDLSQQKDELYKALELATNYFQVKLTKNKNALEYLRKKRKFTKETIINFRLGYSPNTSVGLHEYLNKKGIDLAVQKKAGLVSVRSNRIFDMFRGRIMVPLMDVDGRVIGFTARLLEGGTENKDAPKYFNTPSTLLYDKSRHVFGLNFAKSSIRKEKFVVIVEGNLDVISSHQNDVSNVVATAGTAMTQQQIKTLNRFTGDLRLAFDEDSAGQTAAERTIMLAQPLGINISVINIPSGKDPDELIQKDPALWMKAISEPQYALDWVIDRQAEAVDLDSAVGKRQFTSSVMPLLSAIQDPVEQDHFIAKISERAGVSERALSQKLSGQTNQQLAQSKRKPKNLQSSSNDTDRILLEQHLLALALKFQPIRQTVITIPGDAFVLPDAKNLHAIFLTEHDLQIDLTRPPLQAIADYVKMLLLLLEELYHEADQEELIYQSKRLAARLVSEYIKIKKEPLTKKLSMSSDVETGEILEQVRILDALKNQFDVK